MHVHRLTALDVGHGLHEPGPHAGRAHAAAREIAGQQVFRVLTKKTVEAVYLTGGAAEQYEPPLLQIHLHLLVRLAQFALDGLRAPQQPQILFVFYDDMAHLQLFVQRCTEHYAAAF